jgi:hypothetical protein
MSVIKIQNNLQILKTWKIIFLIKHTFWKDKIQKVTATLHEA